MADQKTTAQKAAEEREKVRRLAIAFREVFGSDGHRSPAQQIVWARLEAMGYVRKPTWALDNDGAIDPLRTLNAEGHRNFFQQIDELVRHASTAEEPKKPEVLTGKSTNHEQESRQ